MYEVISYVTKLLSINGKESEKLKYLTQLYVKVLEVEVFLKILMKLHNVRISKIFRLLYGNVSIDL